MAEILSNAIVEEIDFENLDQCTKGIFTELKDLNQNGLKRIIKTFGIPDSFYDWKIETKTPLIDSSNDAETDWVRDTDGNAISNTYITFINPTFKNTATKNGITRTVLHELIHAFLLSQLDGLPNGNTNQTQFKNNFPLLWSSYIDQDCSCTANEAHHEAIAQLFVNTLAAGLKEWDNSQNDDKYYKDLAWGGLSETDIFKNTNSLTNDERLRISRTNLAEDKNQEQTYINSNNQTITINPKGTDCN